MAKEIQPDNPSTEVEEMRPYQRMVRHLQGMAKINADNGAGFDIAANVVDKMLTVETDDIEAYIDAVLEAGNDGPLKAEDMEGKPFTVQEVQFFKSAEMYSEDSLGTYSVAKVVDAISKKESLFSTGATNVVTTLYAFDQKGVFEGPHNPTLVIRSTPTASGKLYRVARA